MTTTESPMSVVTSLLNLLHSTVNSTVNPLYLWYCLNQYQKYLLCTETALSKGGAADVHIDQYRSTIALVILRFF